ncbi:MAG TPA: hypothetical protein PLS53_07405, partial [Thermoanaerobaculaceae bacterium]|nr:hypothetical protein [Thermoanaerobaculaceae bacterium]
WMLFVVSVVARVALAVSPAISRPLSPPVQAIRAAAKLQSFSLRGEALRTTVLAGLRSGNRELSGEVIDFLRSNSRWIDMEALEPILPELEGPDLMFREMQRLVDDARLWRAPRAERMRVYTTAILDGEAPYGGGGRLMRVTAMKVAAREGLSELLPVIEANLDKLRPEHRLDADLDVLRWEMRLGEGGEDRNEAISLTITRLQEMGRDAVAERGREFPGFRQAVAEAAGFACRKNLIVEGLTPTCIAFRDLYRAVEAQLSPRRPPGQATNASDPTMAPVERWLDDFGGAVGEPWRGFPPR